MIIAFYIPAAFPEKIWQKTARRGT